MASIVSRLSRHILQPAFLLPLGLRLRLGPLRTASPTPDPARGAEVGSQEIVRRLVERTGDDRGVHVESLLCALGSLGGYACQAAVRAMAVAKGLPEVAFLASVETADGATYYLGDSLNRALVKAPQSFLAICAGEAGQAGSTDRMEVSEIFGHASAALGTEAFGIPRVPSNHRPHDAPIDYLRPLWPTLRPVLARCCPDAQHWPLLFGLSVQAALITAAPAIGRSLALRLVIESAIPMSQVSLESASACMNDSA